jgi:hypothetical protein
VSNNTWRHLKTQTTLNSSTSIMVVHNAAIKPKPSALMADQSDYSVQSNVSSLTNSTVRARNTRRPHNEDALSRLLARLSSINWENSLFIALNALIFSMLFVIIAYRRDYSARQIAEQVDTRDTAFREELSIPTFQNDAMSTIVREEQRKNCQIIYVLGVEGATHHGFAPILEYLANNQRDEAGAPYDVVMSSRALKFGLFGWYKAHGNRLGFSETPPIDDPELVRRVIADICPPDGRKHVIVEDNSFPCGQEDDRRSYRVHRQHDWLTMTPEEIANSETGKNQPTDLYRFYKAYKPYAEVKFLVLHRPYLETIASHVGWDTGPVVHSNIIRGFMIILRRFLDAHMIDPKSGEQLWLLICVEKHFAKYYQYNDAMVAEGRRKMLHDVATFLRWPVTECPHCFDSWHESTKDYEATLGRENLQTLGEHMKAMEGIWPPNGKQCRA